MQLEHAFDARQRSALVDASLFKAGAAGFGTVLLSTVRLSTVRLSTVRLDTVRLDTGALIAPATALAAFAAFRVAARLRSAVGRRWQAAARLLMRDRGESCVVHRHGCDPPGEGDGCRGVV
jgi:hypothetical protein